jgi:hypothetical protein
MEGWREPFSTIALSENTFHEISFTYLCWSASTGRSGHREITGLAGFFLLLMMVVVVVVAAVIAAFVLVVVVVVVVVVSTATSSAPSASLGETAPLAFRVRGFLCFLAGVSSPGVTEWDTRDTTHNTTRHDTNGKATPRHTTRTE